MTKAVLKTLPEVTHFHCRQTGAGVVRGTDLLNGLVCAGPARHTVGYNKLTEFTTTGVANIFPNV